MFLNWSVNEEDASGVCVCLCVHTCMCVRVCGSCSQWFFQQTWSHSVVEVWFGSCVTLSVLCSNFFEFFPWALIDFHWAIPFLILPFCDLWLVVLRLQTVMFLSRYLSIRIGIMSFETQPISVRLMIADVIVSLQVRVSGAKWLVQLPLFIGGTVRVGTRFFFLNLIFCVQSQVTSLV